MLILWTTLFFLAPVCWAREVACVHDNGTFVYYDPKDPNANCTDGILSWNYPTTVALPTKVTRTPRQKLVGTCKMERSLEKLGFECCGPEKFHPDHDLCCREVDNVYKYKVHPNKTEEDYVCCGIRDSYKRDSMIPCAIPAKNDRFWKNATKLPAKKSRLPGQRCYKFEHSFLLRVRGKVELGYKTKITRVTGMARTNEIGDRDDMTLRTDKHSPKRSLKNRSFLILSDKDHMDQAKLDIYLEINDMVFSVKGRKHKRMRKVIRKLQRWCRRSKTGRKSRRRGTKRNELMRF